MLGGYLKLPRPFDLVVHDLPCLLERLCWRRHGLGAGEPQTVLVVDCDDEAGLPRQVEPVEVIGLRLEDHPSYSIANPLYVFPCCGVARVVGQETRLPLSSLLADQR